MKNELIKAIKVYCDENHCWKTRLTAKEWNSSLEANYSAATFTALVKDGLLCRDKFYKEKSYSYWLPPTKEDIEKREKAEKEREKAEKERKIENAKWYIEHYDEMVAEIEAFYEEDIKKANERRERDLAWKVKHLEESKALLNEIDI